MLTFHVLCMTLRKVRVAVASGLPFLTAHNVNKVHDHWQR